MARVTNMYIPARAAAVHLNALARAGEGSRSECSSAKLEFIPGFKIE